MAHLTDAMGVQADAGYRRSRQFDQRLNRFQVGGTVVWWLGGK
jgi:hypothetical protein